MSNLKLLLVAGARPNFMKVAPLISAIDDYNALRAQNAKHINYVLVHTGQHYDLEMSEKFFKELRLPTPDINLEVGSDTQAVQTAKILMKFEKVCMHELPDWVVVVGDVNSTMACTLTAVKLGIKAAHVEAGLRSFDRTMPEEINRLVTDTLSDLLLTPSEDADANLLREGIPPKKIKRVGNIMIDTLINHLDEARKSKPHAHLGLAEKNYAFVTLHRPSNVDNKSSLKNIMESIAILSLSMPVVFPVHPRTRKNINSFGILNSLTNYDQLLLCEPLGYRETIGLIDKARFVLTDSGGVQEETTFLKIPCLTLRPNTERPVTITMGTNKLTSLEIMNHDIEQILNNKHANSTLPPLWDGKTAERIVQVLLSLHN